MKKQKKKNQEKLSEDKFRIGDIVMLCPLTTLFIASFKVVAYGRIRKIKNDSLVLKLIPIPGNAKLLRGFYTESISNKNSKNIRKYWIVPKDHATILLKSSESLARYDYKSLMVYTKLKYSKYIKEDLLKL